MVFHNKMAITSGRRKKPGRALQQGGAFLGFLSGFHSQNDEEQNGLIRNLRKNMLYYRYRKKKGGIYLADAHKETVTVRNIWIGVASVWTVEYETPE